MFEVRIMCEDGKLHKVLWALDGLIVGQPQMLPVRNAVASKDKTKVKEKFPAGDSLVRKFLNGLSSLSQEFAWKDAANIMESLGGHRANTSAYLHRLGKENKIIRTGTGRYKTI